jgi:hypothetical protein
LDSLLWSGSSGPLLYLMLRLIIGR